MNRWRWCRLAFKGRCWTDWDEEMPGWERWWHVFKACICLLLNQQGELTTDFVVRVAIDNYNAGYHPEWGQMASWDELTVGYGIFSGWRCRIRSNGYP